MYLSVDAAIRPDRSHTVPTFEVAQARSSPWTSPQRSYAELNAYVRNNRAKLVADAKAGNFNPEQTGIYNKLRAISFFENNANGGQAAGLADSMLSLGKKRDGLRMPIVQQQADAFSQPYFGDVKRK